MKAKINKSGKLEINTESELEEFAVNNWIEFSKLTDCNIKVNHDYDIVKNHENTYEEQQEIIEKLTYRVKEMEDKNSKLEAINSMEKHNPMRY